MEVFPQKKFSSPDEEIAFLKEEIRRREALLTRESSNTEPREVEWEVMHTYASHDPSLVLKKDYSFLPSTIARESASLQESSTPLESMISLAKEKGVRNALSVLEKCNDPFLTDEAHRALISLVREGKAEVDIKKGTQLFQAFHMTLFEVEFPQDTEEERGDQFKSLFSGMEQFYAGMQTIGNAREKGFYSIEIAVSDKSDDIVFYVAVPDGYVSLFEKQTLSLFPRATLREQRNDYNVFVDGGAGLVTAIQTKKYPLYPIKTHDKFDIDPLLVLLNAFSNIERDGGGAAFQVIVGGNPGKHHSTYSGIISRMEKGEKVDAAIKKSTLSGELLESVFDLWRKDQKKQGDEEKPKEIDSEKIELFKTKLSAPVLSTNIRLIASSTTETRASQILTELESCFAQFQNTQGNEFEMKRLGGGEKKREMHAFSFREFMEKRDIPLSITELATIIHFPQEGLHSTPQLKQSHAKKAPAPLDLPQTGTLLGENEYRNRVVKAYLTPEDRLRHFYVIGQTGTGKTTLLKNMIVQDIQEGAGVCMIDPHGTDIVDVLSAIPPERMDDLIYFDPANLEQVIALNMLEYDPRFPEQKTFVVNELFSIFQKLYGANPESMGPMFEQYFRNSTLLVLDDPESGSTLLDISRVMADASFRRLKLAKATNPVVLQFWQQIATKAGGEASLENMVPYITSKFDVFTANDYMRPIIGQQQSSFNFRELMDTNKILLVNLSKGRLGEINANLVGMIIVGKILMAALSRVDKKLGDYPPFYLYIDEFQNVTTNSIAAILSEARKYKLGLTIAHQFIAQIDETIRNAVFGNVGSIGAFRVGADDAEFLSKQFEPVFGPNDIMNIENRNAYVKILANGSPKPPFNIHTMKPYPTNAEYATQLIEYSNLRHGKPRELVEAEIKARFQKE